MWCSKNWGMHRKVKQRCKWHHAFILSYRCRCWSINYPPPPLKIKILTNKQEEGKSRMLLWHIPEELKLNFPLWHLWLFLKIGMKNELKFDICCCFRGLCPAKNQLTLSPSQYSHPQPSETPSYAQREKYPSKCYLLQLSRDFPSLGHHIV